MAEFTRIGYGQVEPNQLSAQKTGQIYASLKLDPEVTVLQNGEFMFYDYVKNMVHGNPEEATITEPYLVFNEIKIYEDWLSLKDFAMIRVGDNYVTNRPATGTLTSANYDGKIYGDGALNKGANISVSYEDANGDTVFYEGHGRYADPDKEDPTIASLDDKDIGTLGLYGDYNYRMDGIAPRLFKTNIGDIYTTNMVETGVEYAVGDILKPLYNEETKTCVLSKNGTVDTVQFAVVKVYTMPDRQPGLKIQRIA